MKLFSKIKEIVEDEEVFVCVLIDEVESLSASRKSAMSGSEPSDSIRVVNALLTQIDQLKQYKNVLILATSNITEAIDIAFIDRADVKYYIGAPSIKARYLILFSCLEELIKTGIISEPNENDKIFSLNDKNFSQSKNSKFLNNICQDLQGLSGRYLRKLPFIVHSLFIKKPQCNINEFLTGISKTIKLKLDQKI